VHGMRFRIAIPILAALSLLCAASLVRAQDPPQESSSKPSEPPGPPPPEPTSKRGKNDKKNKDTAAKSAPDQPAWDPLRAEKDLEVGQYYMRKGDVDAAIDRFEDATLAKPGYAIPFRFLGEAQEKKGLKKQAIKSYQRYLDLYPHAEDGDKIQKRIDKLRKGAEKQKN
jgi:tetratricopeptide (TPR) repeat protein